MFVFRVQQCPLVDSCFIAEAVALNHLKKSLEETFKYQFTSWQKLFHLYSRTSSEKISEGFHRFIDS